MALVVQFGRFTLDAASRRLASDGQEVHLTPKAFDLLVLLVTEAPRVVSKAELHERLWPGTFVSDATLVGMVKELRRALRDQDRSAPIIRTMHRVGYGFALEVRQVVGVPKSDTWHWLIGPEKQFQLRNGDNPIGRGPDSVVWLEAAGVSRRHARIEVDQTGARLEDLGSKNGTRIGDRTVTEPIVLRDGDCIVIGTVPLTYRTTSAPATTETQIRPNGASLIED
jgi:DNA-binding winged helix-turn-helix (wHTH) protein